MDNAQKRAEVYYPIKKGYQSTGYYSQSDSFYNSVKPAPRTPASYAIVKDTDGTYLIVRSSNGHPTQYEIVLRGYSSYETHRVYKLLVESENK